jgi:hypothetical protein
VCLVSIKDVATGHEYMTTPQKLFEFAVDNGPVRESDADLCISQVVWQDPSRVRIIAQSKHPEEPLTFSIAVAVNAGAPAVVVRLQVTSTGTVPVFLRTVLPKISGLLPPGGVLRRRGMVPKEIGCVTDLIGSLGGEHQLGMPLNLDLGLPLGMNALEVASIFDRDGGGGIFFADFDSDLEKGVSRIQLTLSESEVAGFWTTYLEPNKPMLLPGLAIGVHHGGTGTTLSTPMSPRTATAGISRKSRPGSATRVRSTRSPVAAPAASISAFPQCRASAAAEFTSRGNQTTAGGATRQVSTGIRMARSFERAGRRR